MLLRIKSFFTIRNIISKINEERKLKLLKYNKRLQIICNLSLHNYKQFTGKYIVFDANGLGKEYNHNNELIFKGIYNKGEKNGICKEYNCYGGLLFEGKYLNGKRNGKGKEFDYFSGTLIFEGDYLNNKRNGIGKEYDKYGNVKFEGLYVNNKKWTGKGNILKKSEICDSFNFHK